MWRKKSKILLHGTQAKFVNLVITRHGHEHSDFFFKVKSTYVSSSLSLLYILLVFDSDEIYLLFDINIMALETLLSLK